MKTIAIPVLLMFSLLMNSCQQSQFPVTTRQVKKGQVTYINHYPMEWRKFSKIRKTNHLATRPDNNEIVRDTSEIMRMTQPATENLLASVSKDPAPILKEILPLRKEILIISKKNPGEIISKGERFGKTKNNFSPVQSPARGYYSYPVEPLGLTGFISSFLAIILMLALLSPGAGAGLAIAAVLLALAGIILGAISIHRIKHGSRSYSGKGFAIAAITIGSIIILASVIAALVVASSGFQISGGISGI